MTENIKMKYLILYIIDAEKASMKMIKLTYLKLNIAKNEHRNFIR